MLRTPITQNLSALFCTFALLLFGVVCPPTLMAQPKDLTQVMRPNTVPTSLVDHDGPVGFAHEKSDLLPDPDTVFGRLPNGMTYVIKRNILPPGAASVRLRINAGSFRERTDQLGLAHFVEHMAFNGSKSVPEGEMIKILERYGLQFGPDTNAYTNWSSTVYQLDVPKAEPEAIKTALFIMRETASELTLNVSAINKERGVIEGEERARDTPGLRSFLAYARAMTNGQLFVDRFPIGTLDIIKNAPRKSFVDFYEDNYRPEWGTLIIVGDIDPKSIEADIIKSFSDWKAKRAAPLGTLTPGAYVKKPLREISHIETGLTRGVSLVFGRAPIDETQTKEVVHKSHLKQVGFNGLNERFAKRALSADAPYLSASVSYSSLDRTVDTIAVSVSPKTGQEAKALFEAKQMFDQWLRFGLTDAEFDRALKTMTVSYEKDATEESTRRTQSLADSIVSSLDDAWVFSTPSQDLILFNHLMPGLTKEAVNQKLATLLNNYDEALIFYEGDEGARLSEGSLTKTYNEAAKTALGAPQSLGTKAWPYASSPTNAKAKTHMVDEELGLEQLKLDNGVMINLKQTDFKTDQVMVSVEIDGGRLSVAQNKAPDLMAARLIPWMAGGLNKLKTEELIDSLNGKVVGMDLSIDQNEVTLSGVTNRSDLRLQLELLMAFATDMAYDPAIIERSKQAYIENYPQIPSTPGGAFGLYSHKYLSVKDARSTPLSLEQAKAINGQKSFELLQSLLKGQIEITIVGDFSRADALAEIERTFGSLKPRQKIKKRSDGPSLMKGPHAATIRHKGRIDQGLIVTMIPAPDFWSDVRRARGMQLLNNIIRLRMTEEIREKKAIAYSPSVSISSSQDHKGYGVMIMAGEVDPKNFQSFVDSTKEILADLAAKPISEDELLRARKPSVDSIDNTKNSNPYWFGVIQGTSRDPRSLPLIKNRKEMLMSFTPAELQNYAKEINRPDVAVRIEVVSESR